MRVKYIIKRKLKSILELFGFWEAMKKSKLAFRKAIGSLTTFKPEHRCNKAILGDLYARFCVCPDYLNESSVVYSFGCGDNISFDLELIDRFDVAIFAFDPTPKAIEWLNRQSVPKKFHFHEIGLSHYDGIAYFQPPGNPDHVSYSMDIEGNRDDDRIQAEVNRLSSIIKKLGHNRIDLLKIDIEGSEYRVIDDILKSGTRIGQLLVEFHHGIGGIPNNHTTQAINKLRQSGYILFDVSEEQREFSFINLLNVAKPSENIILNSVSLESRT